MSKRIIEAFVLIENADRKHCDVGIIPTEQIYIRWA